MKWPINLKIIVFRVPYLFEKCFVISTEVGLNFIWNNGIIPNSFRSSCCSPFWPQNWKRIKIELELRLDQTYLKRARAIFTFCGFLSSIGHWHLLSVNRILDRRLLSPTLQILYNAQNTVHCCIKWPQNLQLKTLLQRYTGITCRIYNKILRWSNWLLNKSWSTFDIKEMLYFKKHFL